MTELLLSLTSPASRVFAAPLPSELRARWCLLRLPSLGTEQARAVFTLDVGGEAALTLAAAAGPGGAPCLLVFIPLDINEIRVELLGVPEPPSRLPLTACPLSRPRAAAMLFGRAPGRVLRAALGGGAGWRRRVGAALAQGSGETLPESYGLWTTLFDHWSEADVDRLLVSPSRPSWPGILAVVACAEGAETAAARASLESLAAQAAPVRARALLRGAPLAAALEGAAEPYVLILQAGEVLPRHATALLGEWIVRNGAPPALYADEDVIGADGERAAPLFKPEPNRALTLSGTLTRGAWLFRSDWVAAHAPGAAGWAEALRLDLWLRLHEAGRGGETQRVPFILAHRRPDAEQAPAAAIAAVVAAHFDRLGHEARIAADTVPLRVRPVLPEARRRSVALIVPSALRAGHVRRCLRAVLQGTDHDALQLIVVVSQSMPLDAEQRATLTAIGDDPRMRVLMLPVGRFNYSAANNFGARHAQAEFLCMLNDDVAPSAPDWLEAMLGHFADPEVGAVGARLLYPNGTVQHGGIIMGLAGLAEHAHRGLPRRAPGYAHRAVLSQELSAVTGACLLTRRTIYEALDGMDESFPVAFNDVDYCMKLRAAGHRIVYCAEAELVHYESLSLGHHFSGERAALEREEVRRMRQRWADVVAADPFHNPNLSLERGREWETAFPPRIRKASWLAASPLPQPLPAHPSSNPLPQGKEAFSAPPPLAGGGQGEGAMA
ncbi:MAG TPA: glycosyltransferase [Acetobacteraceae bacterium]|nr:glycosyltransferase [Acetobacteraceae bacterium]